ncbi:MAG TPA: AAA family ATPase [Steroidobacteraceae bacterium]|nr:AAA family ATPase [Steroidobacteraceae bacterium]
MATPPVTTTQPVSQDPRRELEMLLASRFALIVIESREETRVLQLVREASLKAGRGRGWAIFQWTATEGLSRVDVDMGGSLKTVSDPAQLLRHIKATPAAGIYVLLDFHPYLTDPLNVRMIKDIAQGYDKVARTIVLMSHEVTVPHELEHLTARLTLGMPTRNERLMAITRVAQEWALAHGGRSPNIDAKALDHLVDNLAGLEAPDTERLARQAIFDDGALTMADLPGVLAAKYELLNRGGTLSYEPDTAKFADVGGLTRLRGWLSSRKPAFDGSAPKLDPPKGVMLLGVQGCGKSLAARAAAGIFSVPLLRLDFSSLYSKWQGESEKNLRDSLRAAEGLAPCVLWVDEIEKSLAAGDGDSGISRRVLGTFLTWLAEQRSRIFVVATANDISALPPELIRKGRFDEIFFVDLPGSEARASILGIHARKRGMELSAPELNALAGRSEGFSGAELEQAIVAALYTSHSTKQPMSASLIAQELRATQPLSVVMAEQVASLRAWARDRTVPAD